jgi:glutaredoxin 3
MKKVIIYSTQTCPFCKMTKDYLDEKGVEYVEKDVTSDDEAQKEMIEKSGAMSVPVIYIEGEIVLGFDKEKLNKLLEIK